MMFWGSKLGTRIDRKSKYEVNMGRPPGLHFFWMLIVLGTQLEAKLGSNIESRQVKTGQDRTKLDVDKTRLDFDKTRPDFD